MDPKTNVISKYFELIEKCLVEWGYESQSAEAYFKRGHIINWLHNFLPSEIPLASILLESIQYKSDHCIAEYVRVLAIELNKICNGDFEKTCFLPLGYSSSSSGAIFLYDIRKRLEISEEKFPLKQYEDIKDRFDRYIFFDDIIGSGNQAIEFGKECLQEGKSEYIYCSIFAFQEGYEKVRTSKLFSTVISPCILSNEERAFHESSEIFDDISKDRLRKMSEKYGWELYPKHPNGYDNSQALIVFPHNTPNNTLPIIWAGPQSESTKGRVWKPLWPRKKILDGKEKVLFRDSAFNDSLVAENISKELPHVDKGSTLVNSEKYEALKDFAQNEYGLGLNFNAAKKWAFENFNIISLSDINKLYQLIHFGFAATGINLSRKKARLWAFKVYQDFSLSKIDFFEKNLLFASSATGLAQDIEQARKWAFQQLGLEFEYPG